MPRSQAIPRAEGQRDPWEGDAWELPEEHESSGDERVFAHEAPPNAAVAAQELGEYLLKLKHRGRLHANHVCIIAFWVSRLGGLPLDSDCLVQKLAYGPGKSSGHYQRHVDVALGARLDSTKYYDLLLPLHDRSDASRIVAPLPVRPLHEALHLELVAQRPCDVAATLDDAIRSGEVPQNYTTNPVVLAEAARDPDDAVPVIPIAIYADGIPITRRDGVVAYYAYSLLSKRRHLLIACRKQDYCRCGCRGWCTTFRLHQFLRWSLEAAAAGTFPLKGVGGAAFDGPKDGARAAIAGARLGFKAVVTLLKGDLQELSATWGFPATGSTNHPCPLCWHHGRDYFDVHGFSVLSTPQPQKTWHDIDMACRGCEIIVHLDWRSLVQVRVALRQDRRSEGNRGLSLVKDIAGLRANDRLEPSSALADVFAIFTFTALTWPDPPPPLTFWRRSMETACRHRSPIWSSGIGVTPNRILALDGLHVLSLGVIQVALGGYFSAMIQARAFGGSETNLQECADYSTLVIAQHLSDWYRSEAQRGRQRTQVVNLESKMLTPTLSLHGVETNHFLDFTVEVLLPRYHLALAPNDGRLWRVCVTTLYDIQILLKDCGPHCLSVASQQQFADLVARHMRASRALGALDEGMIHSRPKHHFLQEMVVRLHCPKKHSSVFVSFVSLFSSNSM